jgi:chitin disaccharide deacetylase
MTASIEEIADPRESARANGPRRLEEQASRNTIAGRRGWLIINADDWGRCVLTTEKTFDCWVQGTISSVSAMVFMSDSERAAELALERGVDTGLHLNFTGEFTGKSVPTRLREEQSRIAHYLGAHSTRRMLFHPGLRETFAYVATAQIDEYQRIYGKSPGRIDGHHHMHLCSNIIFSDLLPKGVIVRRNFTFRRDEKSMANRAYRMLQDKIIARRHPIVDYLFCLTPMDVPGKLEHILSLTNDSVVELETHPVLEEEYRFLQERNNLQIAGNCPIAPCFAVRDHDHQ